MKRLAVIALFFAATLMAAGTASAQDHQVKATIPFNFTLGNQSLPAGTYTIGSNLASPNVLQVRNWDKHVSMITLGHPTEEDRTKGDVLVFHRYGNQYFLSDVCTQGAALNMHFIPTKAEKRAKAQIQEAGLFVNDPVLIALN